MIYDTSNVYIMERPGGAVDMHDFNTVSSLYTSNIVYRSSRRLGHNALCHIRTANKPFKKSNDSGWRQFASLPLHPYILKT